MFDLERLNEIAEGLGPDELAVLIQIAERIAMGRDQYGELDIDKDRRDFSDEAAEEAQDALVYIAAGKIRTQRQRSRGKR